MEETPGTSLMPMTGTTLTEIEAVGILTGATARQIAAGGIRGAEGSVRLLVSGDEQQLRAARELFASLEQESPY
jgi:hypothetical protein